MTCLEKLQNRKPGEIVTIYPHTGVAIFQILKVWLFIGAFLAGYILLNLSGKNPFDPEIRPMIKTGLILLAGGGALFAIHQLLHYANTYLQFSDDAIIYRRGWIPSTTDTIFWINIKDINTSASIPESFLNSGTIMLVVAIRTDMDNVFVPYIPDHEGIADYIRQKLGNFNSRVTQVSYS